MSMTDEQLDRDWKPSGRRPQSTIARSFSQELMDIFRIENSVADLDEEVDKRKHQINTQTTELEALEARIREMELRLKQQHPAAATAQPAYNGPLPHRGGPASPQRQRVPVANAFRADIKQGREGSVRDEAERDNDGPPPPLEKDSKYGGTSRPGTARQAQQAVPGALPPTPVASEGEYEVVEPSTTTTALPYPPAPPAQHPVPPARGQVSLPPPPPPKNRRRPHQYPPVPEEPSRLGTATATRSAAPRSSGTSSDNSSADYVIVSAADGDGEHQDA